MLAGNSKLMELNSALRIIDCHSVGTIIHMAIDGEYAGHIVISDVVKPHAKEAIERLKHAGVEKTVMLTGDTKARGRSGRQRFGRGRGAQRAAAGRQGGAGGEAARREGRQG